MKKKAVYIWFSIFLILLFIGFFGKNKLNDFISDKMRSQITTSEIIPIVEQIDINYNYFKNKKNYDFTLIEFSSTGCAICKQMEPVLEEIKTSERVNVNVVYLHIMDPKNQNLMKYYRISAVPMQILLDKKGSEIFRHYGFISASQIVEKTQTVKYQN